LPSQKPRGSGAGQEINNLAIQPPERAGRKKAAGIMQVSIYFCFP
jgi:hypothetical protein